MAPSYAAQSLFDVKDLVAVITGGGSGLGRIFAHALAANGAKAVYVLGRRAESLAATKDASPNPLVVHPLVCDVTSKDSLAAAAARVAAEVGYCDVLFANSGVCTAYTGAALNAASFSAKGLQEALWAPDMDDFTQSFRVNVAGAYYTVVAFLDLLDQGNQRAVVPQKSQVVVTSSIGAYARLPTGGFAYGSSKAAVSHLAKQLATVLAPFKIRVNTLVPGLYPTEMTAEAPFMKGSADPRQEGSLPKDLVPLERVGSEEDMAGLALFLASKAGAYMDGNAMLTDGGRLAVVPASY